jgi:hypothetical protein
LPQADKTAEINIREETVIAIEIVYAILSPKGILISKSKRAS